MTSQNSSTDRTKKKKKKYNFEVREGSRGVLTCHGDPPLQGLVQMATLYLCTVWRYDLYSAVNSLGLQGVQRQLSTTCPSEAETERRYNTAQIEDNIIHCSQNDIWPR